MDEELQTKESKEYGWTRERIWQYKNMEKILIVSSKTGYNSRYRDKEFISGKIDLIFCMTTQRYHRSFTTSSNSVYDDVNKKRLWQQILFFKSVAFVRMGPDTFYNEISTFYKSVNNFLWQKSLFFQNHDF